MKKKILIILASIFFITVSHNYINTIEADTDTTDYLCFTAMGNEVCIRLEKNGSPAEVNLEIKKNSDSWKPYNVNNDINISNGDKVYFRNTSPTTTGFSSSENDYYIFIITGDDVSVSGDITTLINISGTNTLTSDYCFANLFAECLSITSISGNLLPATTLTTGCYYRMFYGCSYLSFAPVDLLPAVKLAPYCYNYMFCRCDGLYMVPDLPATELASNCYDEMFSGMGWQALCSPIQDDEHRIIYKVPSSGKITSGDASADDITGLFIESVDGVYTIYVKGAPPYSVTYFGNGESSGTVPVDPKTYNNNESVTVLEAGSLVKTSKKFIGWNRNADGSGIIYMPFDVFTITNNVSLYAMWGDYEFTISGDQNYTKESLIDLVLTCDGPKDECQKVYIDGIELTENIEYTIESGSTIITLKGTYLETLDLGDHTLKLSYNNGQEPTMIFKVVNPNSPDSSSKNNNKNNNKYIAPNTGVN